MAIFSKKTLGSITPTLTLPNNKRWMRRILCFIFYFSFLQTAMAETVWKVTVISTMPRKAGIPIEFCRQFAPDTYAASLEQLSQEGARAKNGLGIKYRSANTHQQNGLYFTEIYAMLHRQLAEGRAWNANMYIHLQQLSQNGVADGVWITPECKGRLIAQASEISR